jgi:hypothetical protein
MVYLKGLVVRFILILKPAHYAQAGASSHVCRSFFGSTGGF